MSIDNTYIGPKVYEYDLHWAIWSLRGCLYRMSGGHSVLLSRPCWCCFSLRPLALAFGCYVNGSNTSCMLNVEARP